MQKQNPLRQIEHLKLQIVQLPIGSIQFMVGKLDMVVYDEKESSCATYETKHSDKIVAE